ncbi:MAG: NAD+ synthase [Methanomassiliicoccales archaeon]|nr:MAG: NAD+ synthase [Methanomassiliicoccales archaeon]
MPLQPKFREEMVSVVKMFIRDSLEQSGMSGVVIGMSGGLDSSLLARLSVDALGAGKVQGVFLPDSMTPEGDAEDAESFSKELGMGFEVVPIDEPVESFKKTLGEAAEDLKVLGNIKARCRMIILYQRANSFGRIVLGSGNKSELMVGYFTKFGDGGADFLPLGDLYKTQVREMARFLNLPDRIISKPPCAGLWEGQTDEEELEISYEDLDPILLGIELGMTNGEISERTGSPESEVERIRSMVKASVHKRKIPLIPKIGIKTIGLDWRE